MRTENYRDINAMLRTWIWLVFVHSFTHLINTDCPLCTYCVPGSLLDAENILMMKINMVSNIIDIHKLKGEKDK